MHKLIQSQPYRKMKRSSVESAIMVVILAMKSDMVAENSLLENTEKEVTLERVRVDSKEHEDSNRGQQSRPSVLGPSVGALQVVLRMLVDRKPRRPAPSAPMIRHSGSV